MTDHHDRKAHYLPRQRLTLDLHFRGEGADDMKWISGRDYREVFDLLPLELVDLVAEGLPCYSVLGERVELKWYGERVGFTCYGKPVKDRLEFAKYIDIHRFNVDENRAFLQEKHPEMMEYLARKYPPQGPAATTPPTATTEPDHDQQVDGYSRPLPGDEPKDYIQRLKDKGVHDDEIQYRVYEYRLPRWGFSQWKAHCRVNDIDYPPKGLKGDPDRDKYGKAYRDARDRHLARAGASEKSEFMPEKSEFMT